MKTKTLEVSLLKAREWYNSTNCELKALALKVYSKEELEEKEVIYEDIAEQLQKDEALLVFPIMTPYKSFNKIVAMTKLLQIAEYFNNGWVKKVGEAGYYIRFVGYSICGGVDRYEVVANVTAMNSSCVYFKRKEDAERAIELMGSSLKDLF